MVISVFALVVLILQIWGIVDVLGGDYSSLSKVFWVLFMALFPIISIILYFLTKPASPSSL